MKTKSELLKLAFDEVRKSRNNAISLKEKKLKSLAASAPELLKIENEMIGIGAKAAIAAAKGGAALSLETIKAHTKKLSQTRTLLLHENGLPQDFLEIKYTCKNCNDSGYVNSTICTCVKHMVQKMILVELNRKTPIELSSFSNFNLELYPQELENKGQSSRRKMTDIYMFAEKWSREFSLTSQSLLFAGPTGLGKTHLSLAIANNVIDKGFYVLYASAQDYILELEKERFNSQNQSSSTLEAMIDCDLLIIDDLGVEFTTSFVTSVVYNVINSRLMQQKPTIINTNLTLKELEDKYTARIISRIIGNFAVKIFSGEDIRIKKLRG